MDDMMNGIGVMPGEVQHKHESTWKKVLKTGARAGLWVMEHTPLGTAMEYAGKVGSTADAAAIGTMGTIGKAITLTAANAGRALYNNINPLDSSFERQPYMKFSDIANESGQVAASAYRSIRRTWKPGGTAVMPHAVWNTITKESGNKGLAVSDRGVTPFVMDWGDPISNEVFGKAGELTGKIVRPVAKTLIGDPGRALYSAVAAKVAASPTLSPLVEAGHGLVNTMENSRFFNMALRGETVAQNTANYARRLVMRAEEANSFMETRGLRHALFDFDSSKGKKIGKYLDRWADPNISADTKNAIEGWLKANHVVAPAGDVGEIASLRKSLGAVAKGDREAVLQAAYLDSTGQLSENVAKDLSDRLPGFSYNIDPKTNMLSFNYSGTDPAVSNVLTTVKGLRTRQAEIAKPLLDLGNGETMHILDNTAGIGSMLDSINKASTMPKTTVDALTQWVDKWTSSKTLQRTTTQATEKLDLNRLTNEYAGQIIPANIQIMDKDATANIIDAFKEIEPHLPMMDSSVKANTLSFIATIPEMMKTSRTIDALKNELTPNLMKLLDTDPAAGLAELAKIDAVKHILENNKIRTVSRIADIGTELDNAGLNDAANYFRQATVDPTVMGQSNLDRLADMSTETLTSHLNDAMLPTAVRNVGLQFKNAALANVDSLQIADKQKDVLRRLYGQITDARLSRIKTPDQLDTYLTSLDNRVHKIVGGALDHDLPSMWIGPEVNRLSQEITKGVSMVDSLGQKVIVHDVNRFVANGSSALDDTVRAYYGLDARANQLGRHAGMAVSPKTIRLLDMAKQAAAASVKDKGYDPAIVPALSRMLGWQDDAYGRIMVNAGVMSAEDFARNKGTHLVKGYRFFSENQAVKAYKARVNELLKDGSQDALDEVQLLQEQWADREIMRQQYLRSIGAKPTPFATVKATEQGGFNIGAFTRRNKLPVILERVLKPYDNIADAWTLSQEVGTKNVTLSNYYQTLKQLGLLTDDVEMAKHGWVHLEGGSWGPAKGSYAHPFIATRLQNQTLEGGINGWTNVIGQAKKLMLFDAMTTLRNIASNVFAIHMGTKGAGTFEIASSLGKAFFDHDRNGPLSQAYTKYSPLGTGAMLENMPRKMDLEQIMQLRKSTVPGRVWDWMSHVATAATSGLFNRIEETSKLAMFDILKKRNPLASDLDHVLQVEKWMVDYHDVPAIVDILRRRTGILPFITYGYKMAGNVVKSTVENPEIATKILGKVYRANSGSAPGGDFNAELSLLPKFNDDRLLLKLPSGIPGMTDKDKPGKNMTILDMSYFLPHSIFSPFFDSTQTMDQGVAMSIAQTLKGFSPILTLLDELASNKSFYGNPITYGGSAANQAQDYLTYSLFKSIPLAGRIARTVAAAQHAEELGLSGKSRTPQTPLDKFLSARHYELDDEVVARATAIQRQLHSLRKTNVQMLNRIKTSEDFSQKIAGMRLTGYIEQRLDPSRIIKENNDKIQTLLQQQDELDRKAVKIENLTAMTDALGIDRAAAQTYEQFMIDWNESGDKASNFSRLADGIGEGDWTKYIAPSIKAAIEMLDKVGTTPVASPAMPAPVGGGTRGPIGGNAEVKGKASGAITRMNQPPLIPPPGRLNR